MKKNENNEDLSRSNDYPPANFINREKLNPPNSSVDGERLSLKIHKHPTNQGTNTHCPTDSVKGDRLNLNTYNPLITKQREHSPIKSITGPSSCKSPKGTHILNGQMDAISEENNKLEETDCKEVTPNSGEISEDQSDRKVTTLLGNDPHYQAHILGKQ